MEDQIAKPSGHTQESPARRAYKKPRLERFGTLTEITAGLGATNNADSPGSDFKTS